MTLASLTRRVKGFTHFKLGLPMLVSTAATLTLVAGALAQTAAPEKTAAVATPTRQGRTADAQTSPPTPAKPPSATSALPSAEESREAHLSSDAAKLLQLAQELKAEVDKSNKDTLSFAVVKKAGEVERLAHDLKERMKAEAPKGR